MVHDAIKNMNLSCSELHETRLARLINLKLELNALLMCVKELEVKNDNIGMPVLPLDAEKVWAKWSSSRFDYDQLSLREKRMLCVSPITAMRNEHVKMLSEQPDALKRLVIFYGFVNAYFGHWRTLENPEQVEKLILDRIQSENSSRSSGRLFEWAKHPLLFSSEAATKIAQVVVSEHASIKQVCDLIFVDTTSKLAQSAEEMTVILAVNTLVGNQYSITAEEATKELSWISNILITKYLKPEIFRKEIEKLILSDLQLRNITFASNLLNLVIRDERLGDPRISSSASNWRGMSDARDRILSRLAKETIEFFFNALVPANDENRRRADFWLKYTKKPGKIKDFQVAISQEDKYNIHNRNDNLVEYSNLEGGKTSAFLMVFEGFKEEFVVIEFSETGNAAYIYQRRKFEYIGINLRTKLYHRQHLKRMDDVRDRIVHNGNWEIPATQKLAELGIRP